MENKPTSDRNADSLPPVPDAEEEILIIEELSFSEPAPQAQPEVTDTVLPEIQNAAAPDSENKQQLPELLPAEAGSEAETTSAEDMPAQEILATEEKSEPDAVMAEEVSAPETCLIEESSVEETASTEPESPSDSEADPGNLSVQPQEELPGELIPAQWDDQPESQMPVLQRQEPDPALEILSDPEFAPPPPPQETPEEVNDQQYSDVPPQPDTEAADNGKKKKKEKPRATLKGRPKRKKGEGFFGIPNILATCVWMGLILAIGITLGRMLWICAADVLAFGRPDQKVTVTVYEADTMDDVIDKLHAKGLIRYKSLFKLYADISDAEEDIKPGIYDLNTRYDYHALVNFMSPSSTREVIELTIPEGYTCRQIYALLEENRVCTSVDIASYAADGELSEYWFLENVERGSEYCLEGFLFPDTYQFYKNSSPREALEKMLDNFDNRFSEEMRAQIDTLNTEVTGGGYGVREIVIVASLIEKESAAPGESPNIASVIYNRLHNWDYPALLNIDAAIVYAQGGDAETIDTGIDSPYNTYRYTGLTPTPISNPGLSSLKAALNPESTDYYFYVLNPDTGMHQFSTTQAEHDAWIAQFYD